MKYDDALTIVNELTRQFLPPLQAWIIKSKVHIEQGQLNQALQSINPVLEEDPRHLEALVTRAGLLIEQKQIDAADDDLENALIEFPNEPRAVFLKAVIAAQDNNQNVANQALQQVTDALKQLSNDTLALYPNYYYLASVSFYLQNDLNQAKDFIQRYLLRDPYSFSCTQVISFYRFC